MLESNFLHTNSGSDVFEKVRRKSCANFRKHDLTADFVVCAAPRTFYIFARAPIVVISVVIGDGFAAKRRSENERELPY